MVVGQWAAAIAWRRHPVVAAQKSGSSDNNDDNKIKGNSSNSTEALITWREGGKWLEGGERMKRGQRAMELRRRVAAAAQQRCWQHNSSGNVAAGWRG